MHISNILRVSGIFLLFYCLTFLPPIFVAFWFDESILDFLYSSLLILSIGTLLWLPNRHQHREIRSREGFLIVSLLWILLCLCSTFPFVFAEIATFTDALFEATSGLTTTGAAVFTNLESMPKSILYYRQQLQFIGGGGVILFGIAILPMLGVGGMQLFRAEMAGPFKEDKLTPRIAQTAKALWLIYVILVVICALCFWLTGMSGFDAISHSFATVSTGGFSTHDQNFMYFKEPAVHWVAIIFMFLGAVNFSLHFTAVHRLSFRHYWQDLEFRSFFIFIIISSILVTLTLIFHNVFNSVSTSFLQSVFQVVAFFTTTGFASSNYGNFPTYIPVFLILLSIIGGCYGSTAGGIKIVRVLLMNKQSGREIDRLIHPSGHYVIKLGYSRLHHRTLDAIWGFLGVYLASFVILLLLLLATGLDFLSAFSGLGACVSTGGLGLGQLAENFKSLNDSAKIILVVAMLLGRLEFFTLLVLLSPSYWRN